jgi:hypothetical protein
VHERDPEDRSPVEARAFDGNTAVRVHVWTSQDLFTFKVSGIFTRMPSHSSVKPLGPVRPSCWMS